MRGGKLLRGAEQAVQLASSGTPAVAVASSGVLMLELSTWAEAIFFISSLLIFTPVGKLCARDRAVGDLGMRGNSQVAKCRRLSLGVGQTRKHTEHLTLASISHARAQTHTHTLYTDTGTH